jgi:hypothetical protein
MMSKEQAAVTAALTGEHFCKDCKHRRLTWKWPLGLLMHRSIYYWARCFHPDVMITSAIKGVEYPVDGSVLMKRIVRFCSKARDDKDSCGPSGRFWEAK